MAAVVQIVDDEHVSHALAEEPLKSMVEPITVHDKPVERLCAKYGCHGGLGIVPRSRIRMDQADVEAVSRDRRRHVAWQVCANEEYLGIARPQAFRQCEAPDDVASADGIRRITSKQYAHVSALTCPIFSKRQCGRLLALFSIQAAT